MPPLLLGLPGDNTFANYSEANRAFWRQTVLPLVTRVQKSFAAWLQPAYPPFRLDYNADRLKALAAERASEWTRIGGASFLTLDEQREAVGYGPAPKDGLFGKYSPSQPRAPRGSPQGGQWTGGGGGGGGGGSGGVTGSVSLLDQAPAQVALNVDPNVVSDAVGSLIQRITDFAVQLIDEEGGPHKGHTIQDHVGKSDEQLKKATRDTITRIKGLWVWKDEIGSFSSLTAANKLVNATLARNANLLQEIIDGKLGGGVAEAWFSTPTGYQSYLSNPKADVEIRTTYGVRVIIVRDKTSQGFRVKTAYPIYAPGKP